MKLDKKDYTIASSNGTKVKHEDKRFATLVSNLSLFNETYSRVFEGVTTFPELKQWNDSVGPDGFPDDSDYSNEKTLDEIIQENYDPTNPPGPNVSFDCIISVELIWSSDNREFDTVLKLKGNDRPFTQTERSEVHLKDLRQINPITGEENKGFSTADCMKLAGRIRVTKNKNGKLIFTVVKTEGNGRFVKKMIANFDSKNPSKKVWLPFTIFFHPQDASPKEMNKIEAGQHHVDAEQRMTQNEGQKFASGIAMENPASVYCKEFLTGLELDFQDHMNAERRENKLPPWPSVSSISRINLGEDKGMFALHSKKGNQPGYKYTRLGFQTAREIAEDITGEGKDGTLIMSSAAQVFASMYHSFCSNHLSTVVGQKPQKALFTEEQLKKYFKEFFIRNQYDENDPYGDMEPEDAMSLKKLSLSGGIKSLEFLAVTKFWANERPKIGRWWKKNVATVNGQQRKNEFTADHDCAVNFINKTDKLLRGHMKTAINNH